MGSNSGMASALCKFSAMTGSWQSLLSDLADFGRLQPQDVQEVAATLFAPTNSYTGFILPRPSRVSARTAVSA